jgi:hypothetical protein
VLAESVQRLTYTREQAAEALSISLATLDRRVTPVISTVMTESGRRLIPVAELERYLVERTQPPRAERREPRSAGRKRGLPPALEARIRDEHLRGKSLGEIARGLNTDGAKTAQGGRQWWPSTVQTVLRRLAPPTGQPRRRATTTNPAPIERDDDANDAIRRPVPPT